MPLFLADIDENGEGIDNRGLLRDLSGLLQLYTLINDVLQSDSIPAGSSTSTECDPIIRAELSRNPHLGIPWKRGKLAMQ